MIVRGNCWSWILKMIILKHVLNDDCYWNEMKVVDNGREDREGEMWSFSM